MGSGECLEHLVVEPQNACEHGGCAWNLLLLVHRRSVGRVRLEVVSHSLTDEGQERQ